MVTYTQHNDSRWTWHDILSDNLLSTNRQTGHPHVAVNQMATTAQLEGGGPWSFRLRLALSKAVSYLPIAVDTDAL